MTFGLITYRQKAFVAEAVRSALAQDYVSLEIVICDDASPDQTWELASGIVRSYAGPHTVRLYRNEQNLGIGNFNRLMELATSELVVIAHGDDISRPDRARLIAEAWRSTRASMIVSNWIDIDERGRKLGLGIGPGQPVSNELRDLAARGRSPSTVGAVTLLGPSGCGKTVLLRRIAGFEKPDAGSIRIGDRSVSDIAASVNVPPNERGLGVVFQDYAVWPHMSVFDNIAYPLKLAGVDGRALRARVTESVAQVSLGGLESRLPSQLSGRQQQRVALARALVAKPALLLLDEPLCNLDANLREEMRFEIKELQRTLGITILYVTHDQEIALAISIAPPWWRTAWASRRV